MFGTHPFLHGRDFGLQVGGREVVIRYVLAALAEDLGAGVMPVELRPPAVVLTSCSQSGPEGGARFRTGAEGTMNAIRWSTTWM
jgi:hypothetical protein